MITPNMLSNSFKPLTTGISYWIASHALGLVFVLMWEEREVKWCYIETIDYPKKIIKML